jgi:hypothetical protein
MTAILSGYVSALTTQASALYKVAKEYVKAKPADPNGRYLWKLSDGREILLSDLSKKLAMRYTTVDNQEAQYKRINNVVSLALGVAVYHYGFWQRNLLWSCLVTPIALAHNKANELISEHFRIEKEALRQEIAKRLN